MANLTERLADEFLRHEIDLMRYSASVRRKILGNLKTMEMELLQKIKKIGKPESHTQAARLKRLERMLEETKSIIKSAYSKNSRALRSELKELSEYEHQLVTRKMNTTVGFDLATGTISPDKLNAIASDALVQGAPSSEWWGRQSAAMRNRFGDQMRQGILQGESIPDMVRRVRGTATGKFVSYEVDGVVRKFREFEGGIMQTSTREAEALVRTSVQQVANDAQMASYEANKDVIRGVQAEVVFDNRTTPLCISRSGAAWDFEGKPFPESTVQESFPGPPPWHWNCRTNLIPVTKSWEQMVNEAKGSKSSKKFARKVDKASKQLGKSTRASMDGQIAGDLTYEKWMKGKGKAFQQEVLGKEKARLFRKGKVSVQDLVDQQTGRPKRLDEL